MSLDADTMVQPPRIKRPVPPYEQVAAFLSERITSGDLKPGDRIPSERELAESWNISRATATKAVAVLRSSGLVESVVGVGTRVATRKRMTQSPRDRYLGAPTLDAMRARDENVDIGIERTIADAEVATALEIDEGANVVTRRRRITVAGDPTELSASWFSNDMVERCPDLAERVPVRGGTTAYIARTLGLRQLSVFDDVSIGEAGEEEADRLGVKRGSSLFVTRTTVVAEEAGPIAYEVYTHLPSHHSHYDYELRS